MNAKKVSIGSDVTHKNFRDGVKRDQATSPGLPYNFGKAQMHILDSPSVDLQSQIDHIIKHTSNDSSISDSKYEGIKSLFHDQISKLDF